MASFNSFRSLDPATGETVWSGTAASAEDVAGAVGLARARFPAWAQRPLAERAGVLRAYAAILERDLPGFAEAISREVGKPFWEAQTEVRAMIGKIPLSIEAHERRCGEFRQGGAITRFRPHGVLAVLGPFNFPGHLPNGHIVPALLAGNAVVYKPSEYAPAVAERMTAAWREAGLPEGVLTLVQGGAATGAALAAEPGIDGLLFTGSARAGQLLARQFAATPAKILALEMGGNNPQVVWDVGNVAAAAVLVVQSAFLSAGQRCTCARRLIVPPGAPGDAIVSAVATLMRTLRVGAFTDRPEPFMGPVVSARTAEQLLAVQEELVAAGAEPVLALRPLRPGTGLLAPGLLDVTPVRLRRDEEWFGPLLQLIRVPDFEAALTEANATRYGLAAGLLSDRAERYEAFRHHVRAGVVNWNQPLTGASSAAPFGGVGLSGNHRPSAYFAADYCSYPVASLEQSTVALPATLPPGLDAAGGASAASSAP